MGIFKRDCSVEKKKKIQSTTKPEKDIQVQKSDPENRTIPRQRATVFRNNHISGPVVEAKGQLPPNLCEDDTQDNENKTILCAQPCIFKQSSEPSKLEDFQRTIQCDQNHISTGSNEHVAFCAQNLILKLDSIETTSVHEPSTDPFGAETQQTNEQKLGTGLDSLLERPLDRKASLEDKLNLNESSKTLKTMVRNYSRTMSSSWTNRNSPCSFSHQRSLDRASLRIPKKNSGCSEKIGSLRYSPASSSLPDLNGLRDSKEVLIKRLSAQNDTEIICCSSQDSLDDASQLSSNSSASTSSLPDVDSKMSSSKLEWEKLRNLKARIRKTKSIDNETVDNPWFQDSTKDATNICDGCLPPRDNEDETERKKRSKSLHKLKKVVRNSTRLPGRRNSFDSSVTSIDSLSLPTSTSGGSSTHNIEINSTPTENDTDVENFIRKAICGKHSLTDVLDVLLALGGKGGDNVTEITMKYLSSNIAIESSIKILSGNTRTKDMTANQNLTVEYIRFLIQAYVSGPHTLRNAFMNNSKVKTWILKCMSLDYWTDVELSERMIVASAQVKILNCILVENPTEFAGLLGNKKGVIRNLVQNYIHIPEMADFVVRLCAADPLTSEKSEDIRYGAPNAVGIMTVRKEGICDLLVEVFIDSCGSFSGGVGTSLSWLTQVMAVKCLFELSKRAIAVPQFNKSNCSFGNKHIKNLNIALDDMNVFHSYSRVCSLLEASLETLSEGLGVSCSGTVPERNNPLVCVLSALSDLFEMIQNASKSKLAITRRTARSVNTVQMEIELLSRCERLCKLLEPKLNQDVTGRTRLTIVNIFRRLFNSGRNETWIGLSHYGIANKLIRTVEDYKLSCILQTCVFGCLSDCLKNSEALLLHQAWFLALGGENGWLKEIERILKKMKDDECECVNELDSIGDKSSYIQVGMILLDFIEEEPKNRINSLVSQEFVDKLRNLREILAKPCGGEKPEGHKISVLADSKSLAALLNDVNAV